VYIFIDTNILLSFYHYTNDDLNELQKLVEAITKGSLTLVLPDQIIQEFWRNREAKIADALSQLKGQKLDLRFPQMCMHSQLFSSIRQAQRNYSQLHGELLNELSQAAVSRSLKADLVVSDLFKVAKAYLTDRDTVAKAQFRISLGNPPGKNGSLGDAINWEILLTEIPNGEDLYLVSDDKDYRSPMDENCLSQFLEMEWHSSKGSSVQYYRTLSAFFIDHYPSIKLATDREIEKLISALAGSESFAQTHSIVSRFNQFTEFTDGQIDQIIYAMLSNNQVYWILRDEDVYEFGSRIAEKAGDKVSTNNLSLLKDLLDDEKSAPRELPDLLDIPF
jgi:predicted nucleic acid-binding protein